MTIRTWSSGPFVIFFFFFKKYLKICLKKIILNSMGKYPPQSFLKHDFHQIFQDKKASYT